MAIKTKTIIKIKIDNISIKLYIIKFMRDLILIILFFVIGIFVIKILWAWTIPEIFPGAVEQGLIVKNIRWFSALKLSVLFSMIATVARISKK